MSIQSVRFANLSAQLAEDVALYDALDLNLDDIDTSILGDAGMSESGDVEDSTMIASEVRPNVDENPEEEDQDMTMPAPVTPVIEMGFTSSSLNPIMPAALDVPAITSDESPIDISIEDRSTTMMPDVMAHSLTQLSWLRKCGVGFTAYGYKPEGSAVDAPSSSQPPARHSGQHEELAKVITPAATETRPSPLLSSARRGPLTKVKRSKLGHRKDAPMIRESGRGSLDKALAAGSSEHRALALARLEADEVARSGVGPKQSRWKTWCKLHHNWFGKGVPVLPLTMDKLAAVIAQLKEGRYHAAADYASTAKSMHLKKFEWSSMLARQLNVCLRSALRGLGPAK